MNSAELSRIDPALDLWLNKPVPRYTSYPPAPAFRTEIRGDSFLSSLHNLGTEEPLSVYIHIPFCHELCLYCGCHTTVTRKQERIAAYVEALKQEIAIVAAQLPSCKIYHLHFGGGTPNILTTAMLDDLFAHLRQHFHFAQQAEVAMELDPRHVDDELVQTLSRNRVNRVSLGVQDFAEPVQKLVNRIQPYQQVSDVCALLRAHGIKRINFDLMYGLPLQTISSVEETARLVCSLKPERIALFSYAHVPQMKKHQIALEVAGLPTMHDRLSMDMAARAVLRRADYHEIGMDHFAQPDDELHIAAQHKALHRNFQGYTTDTHKTLVAFGASAISQTADGFYQNEHDIEGYQTAITATGCAKVRGITLLDEDKVRAEIIESLMCNFSCDVHEICLRHQFPFDRLARSFEILDTYKMRGLIKIDQGVVSLLSPFRMAVRVVAQAFDAYALASISSRAA